MSERESLSDARPTNYTRYWHNLVVVRLADIPGIPIDLSPITLVYSKGDAQDVCVVIEGDEDLTIRNEFATPLEHSAIQAALKEARYES